MGRTRTSFVAALSAAAAAVSLAGCGSGDPRPATPSQGDDAPTAAPGEVQTGELVAGLNGFGLDFLRLLTEGAPNENVVFSPLSIELAFGMAEVGARGETAEQIAEVLGFPSSGAGLHTAFGKLSQELSDSGKSTVRLANRMYPRIDFQLVEEFVKTLDAAYGAPVERLDFRGDKEASRRRINDWVAERTEGRIKELLDRDFIKPDTVLVLVNALYLEAKWSQPFGKETTQPAPFTLLDGSGIEAPLMHNPELHTRFLNSSALQAVEIPYGEGELSMLVLVPAEGAFAEFERELDTAELAGIDGRMTEGIVDLALPRWKARFKVDLIDSLKQLGLTIPFEYRAADFSGLSPTDTYIDEAVHAADIEVDEKGTVAAAATALGFREVAATTPDAAIQIDRPFLYLIRDTETGTVMFAGRVVDPTA